MQTLMLADRLFPALWTGTKTGTVRTGHRTITEGPLLLQAVEGTCPDAVVNVGTVLHTTLADLPDWAIAMEGADSLDAVIAALRAHYPDITPDSPVTAVRFADWAFRPGEAPSFSFAATLAA